MRIKHFEIEGLIEFFPDIHKDDRGCFVETWQETRYQKLGISSHFVQDNFSFSSYGTLRGLHFQINYPQDKLVRVLWIPPGFAHGFFVLSPKALVTYKCTDFYHPSDEGCIKWNDPDVGIDWPININPTLSPKDACAPSFRTFTSGLVS